MVILFDCFQNGYRVVYLQMQLDENQTLVIFIRGIPGSGKSTIASILKDNLPANTEVLDPDYIEFEGQAYLAHLKEMVTQNVDPKLYVYRFLRQLVYQNITDRRLTIWNQPFTSLEIFNKITTRLYEHAKSVGVGLKILIVEVEVDPRLASKRIGKRVAEGGHGPSNSKFNQFVSDYQSFANSGYEVEVVNGTSSKQASEKILARLAS